MPCRSSVLEVNALIEAGTISRFSDRFSAVTTISVRPPVSSTAASAALAGAPCRIASTARVSADIPLNEPALIIAFCDRIPRLVVLEDMLYPPCSPYSDDSQPRRGGFFLIYPLPGGSRATYGRSTLTMRILSLRNSWRKHHARGDISLTNGATRLICSLAERC